MRPLIFLLLALYGCESNHGDKIMPPEVIEIKIGWTGEEFLRRNNLPAKGSVDKQPAGLNFYEVDWTVSARGTVRLEHGGYSFDIPHALGVVGTENVERLGAASGATLIRPALGPPAP